MQGFQVRADVCPAGKSASRPRVLYLTHRVPYPPDKGDRIRNFHLLKYLARKNDVCLACLADEPVSPETLRGLRPYCARLAVVPVRGPLRWLRTAMALATGNTASEGAFASPALTALLRRWAGEARFDAAFASASSLIGYLRLAELRDVPVMIDLVDVDSQKWLDYAAAGRGPRSWLYRLEGRRLRELERKLPSWALAVTLVSEAEADIYRQFAEPGLVQAIPNGVDLDYFRDMGHDRESAVEPACAFVGALDYRPNVDAACWFAAEVWPQIRARRPDARLWLIGRRPTSAVLRLAEVPGVEVVGQVPDVRPYLARAALAVVPLRLARGIQNKVLEALAMGKATVASPAALAGLRQVRPGTHLLSASAPAEWVQAVTALLEQPEQRAVLGEAGRAYVETHHEWGRCLAPFDDLIDLACKMGGVAR